MQDIRSFNDLQQQVEQLIQGVYGGLIETSRALLDDAYSGVVLNGEALRGDADSSVLAPAQSVKNLGDSLLTAGQSLKDYFLGPDDASGLVGSAQAMSGAFDVQLTDAGESLVAVEESQGEVPDIDFDDDSFGNDDYGDYENEDLPLLDGGLQEIDDLGDEIDALLNAAFDGDAFASAAELGLSAQADALAAYVDFALIPSADAFLSRSDAYLANSVDVFDAAANTAYLGHATTVMDMAEAVKARVASLLASRLGYLEGANDDPAQGTAACAFDFSTTHTIKDTLGFNIFVGTNGNDLMRGSDDSDYMFGRGGRDKMEGKKGFDFLYGGAGSDSLKGEEGFDILIGGGDHDAVDGADGGPSLTIRAAGNLGPNDPGIIFTLGNLMLGDFPVTGLVSVVHGNDCIIGGKDIDIAFGQQGNDEIEGKEGIDVLFGDGGDDSIKGGDGQNIVFVPEQTGVSCGFSLNFGNVMFGRGDNQPYASDVDTLDGGTGMDLQFGGPDKDTLKGHDGIDIQFGMDGDDALEGGDGDLAFRLMLTPGVCTDFRLGNLQFGGEGDDNITAGKDIDLQFGANGDDEIHGGSPDSGSVLALLIDDLQFGGAGDDRMFGDLGHDLMFGRGGEDLMEGDSDSPLIALLEGTASIIDDIMFGGDGIDTMRGGALPDFMFGGNGDDDMEGDSGQFFPSVGWPNDVMLGGAGSDTMRGGRGSDLMIGQADDDVIDGDDGGFQINVALLNDVIIGGDGADVLSGHAGSDIVIGGQGDDEIHGGGGLLDLLFGNLGDDVIDGQAGSDIAFGGAGRDTITGDDYPDILFGGADQDVIDGNAGLDVIFGGGDDDQLNGSGGFDLIFGNDGNDWIHGDSGPDLLFGNRGDDMVLGDEGMDFAFGNRGNDIVHGDGDRDFVWGNEGDDQVYGDLWKDFVFGGDGDDRAYGGESRDFVYGGSGQDCVFGNEGDDRLFGGAGDDFVYGGEGNDRMRGDRRIPSFSDGNDVMWGEAGDDRMRGGGGNDLMDGGDGNDRIRGRKGQDTIYGRAGDDRIWGGDNSDLIDSGGGADVVRGGADNDTIFGGTEDDQLRGGRGDDTIFGDQGDDRLRGNLGSDSGAGGDGSDDVTNAFQKDGPNPVLAGGLPHAACSEIHGAKWYDADNDGVRDPEEPLLGNITILIDRINDGTIDYTTVTMADDPNTHDDETGMYWLTGLLPGVYAIREQRSGTLAQTSPYPQPAHVITLGAGESLTGLDFGNVEGASIHGRKWNDINGNGALDPGEPGIDGWLVMLYDSAGNLVRTAETMSMDLDHSGAINPDTEQGLYWFGNLRPGAYTVREATRAGWQPSFPASTATTSGTLYAVSQFYGQPRLASVSPITGAATDIGATGVQLLGLSYASNTQQLLGVPAPVSSTTVRTLYSLNPTTGQATARGSTALTVANREGGFGVEAGAAAGFYASGGQLNEVNLTTGAIVNSLPLTLGIGEQPINPEVNIDGLDFLNGVLYGIITEDFGMLGGALNDYLIEINASTGVIRPVGPLNIDLKILGGLATDQAAGVIYISGNTFSGAENLYSVSPINGAASLIGPTGLTDLSGLAYLPPVIVPADHQVTVVSGQVLEGVDFGNQSMGEAPGAIHGQKWHDLDGDGVRDPDEPGLDAWEITLRDSAGNLVTTQKTHSMDRDGDGLIDPVTEQGLYWFEDLLPGEYHVSETQQSTWRVSFPAMGVHTALVGFGEIVTGVDFGNWLAPTIHGKKGEDVNKNGQYDSGTTRLVGGAYDQYAQNPGGLEAATPHADLTLAFSGALTTDYDAPTTQVGRYLLDSLNLPSGVVGIRSARLTIGARPTSGPTPSNDLLQLGVWGGTSSAADRAAYYFGAGNSGSTLLTGAWTQANYPTGQVFTISLPSNVLAAMEAYRRIDLVVQNDTNVDFVQLDIDFAEPCIADWQVNLTGVDGQGNPVSRVAFTMADDPNTPDNEQGMYWFDDLAPGVYTIQEQTAGGWSTVAPANGSQTVTLSSGQRLEHADFLNRRIANTFGDLDLETDFGAILAGFSHFFQNAGGAGGNILTFDGLAGAIAADFFRAEYGVLFANQDASSVFQEGPSVVEALDGYDGSYADDGDNVYVILENHLDPFTITFDEPVSAVGSFIATGKEGVIADVTVSAFDAADNLITVFVAHVRPFADPDNREGFWAIETTGGAEIAKVTIQNNNPIDFGNVLVVDNLQWVRTPNLPLPGDYNQDGSVDSADYTVWRDTAGEVGVEPFSGADGDGDGVIDGKDYGVWKANFGATSPAPATGAAALAVAVSNERAIEVGSVEAAVASSKTTSVGFERRLEPEETINRLALLESISERRDGASLPRKPLYRSHAVEAAGDRLILLLAVDRVGRVSHRGDSLIDGTEGDDHRDQNHFSESLTDESRSLALAEW